MSEDLELEKIREHYDRIEPVVEELADVDGQLTIGLNDYNGWYIRRDHDDFDTIEAGFEQKARCATLAKDYDEVSGRIKRALYALTTYKDPEAFITWEPCTIDDGETKWMNSRPTPGYADLRGVMVWGDIDLEDDLKPQRGDLDAETQALIEETLGAYIDEYATLYGDRDAVFALDSVGGSYIAGAPAATLPIAEHFEDDRDALERVMEAFVDRSNDWLHEAQQRVEERVDGAADVIDPDWVNNCNRQYKAPLSLHTSHDAVVVPLDTDDPSYEMVPFAAVDDDLVEDTTDWAAQLTSTDHRDRVASLVEHLWPEEYEEHENWQDALDAWVQEEREVEEKEEEARQRARERRRERKEEIGTGLEGTPITPFIGDVYDALNQIDTADVVKNHACSAWDTGRDSNSKVEFDPSWRTSESGSSCFVDLEKNAFGDSGEGGGGYAAKAMALGSPDIDFNDSTDDLTGKEWRQAVDELRGAGYEIPVWTPDANSQDESGDEYGKMPYWAVRKAAVALGVLPEDAFIPAQTSGGGYLKFPGAETYNHALAAIEDVGLEHGREYMTSDGTRPESTPTAVAETSSEEPDPAVPDDVPPEEDVPAATDAEKESGGADNSSAFGAHTELDAHHGGYGYWKTNRDTGKTWFERVTNFMLEVDSFLFNDGERLIKMTVVPSTGEDPYDVTVPTKVFNDVRRFRDRVVTGLTTTFDGGSSDLNELRKLVGSQDAPVRVGTHHMGLHPDVGEWVTPNGVLTADGWTDDPEMVYIEREISAEQAWMLSPEEHTEYDPEEVAEILELIPKSRYSERFLPVLGWLYTAPLRPYVQDWEGQINTLHVTGDTGAGKSSSLSLGWRLFGMHGEPMSCDDTKFALLTSMASTNSIPIWFDEYKPGDMKDWEVDRFQNLMRSTTRGGIATRGNADKSTEQYHLKAPLMISGEQAIQGPAEQRRSIQTRFREGVKEDGSPTKIAFSKLSGMTYEDGGETHEPKGYDLEQHALAYYQHVLRQDEEALRDQWRESRDYVLALLDSNGITGIDDLPRQGLQTVHFGMMLYRQFAQQMASEAGIDEVDLPSDEEVADALLYIARQYGGEEGRKSHLDRFIELTSRAANEDYLEAEKHFKLVNEGSPDEQLALKLSSVHDRVSKYVSDHALGAEDLLNSATDYRDRMAEAEDDAASYVVTNTQYTPPLARCARIDTELAEEQLEFSRLAFGAEPRDGDEGVEGDGDDDGPDDRLGALQLSDVAEDPTGYATVTVEVLTVETPEHENAPSMRATVKDVSTAIDVISWNDSEALPKEGTFLLENAQVGKHDGQVQLTIREGVTEVKSIQPGVGHTEALAPAEGQEQLGDTVGESEQAKADGGQTDVEESPPDGAESVPDEDGVPDDAEGLLADAQRLVRLLNLEREPLTKASLTAKAARKHDFDPERTETVIEYAVSERGLLIETSDGYEVA